MQSGLGRSLPEGPVLGGTRPTAGVRCEARGPQVEPRDRGGRGVRPRSADQRGEDVDAVWSVEEAPGGYGVEGEGAHRAQRAWHEAGIQQVLVK